MARCCGTRRKSGKPLFLTQADVSLLARAINPEYPRFQLGEQRIANRLGIRYSVKRKIVIHNLKLVYR